MQLILSIHTYGLIGELVLHCPLLFAKAGSTELYGQNILRWIGFILEYSLGGGCVRYQGYHPPHDPKVIPRQGKRIAAAVAEQQSPK